MRVATMAENFFDQFLFSASAIETKSYYSLRAVKIKKAPIMDGNISDEEWPGLSVRLSSKKSVVQSRKAWCGPTDLSAKLGAVIQDDNLYLRAEVTDDQVTDGDQVQLVTETGKIVKPAENKMRLVNNGYVVEARYPLKQLAPSREQYSPLLKLSAEIVDVDKSPRKITKVMSTSCGGRKYAGSIIPTQFAGLPPIDNNEDH
jgi:hypothetical protein